MNTLLTIFTPTYNRANLLPRLYESLLHQSSSNFMWMIVDDGSTDNTEKLAKQWIQDSPFPVEYYKKDNGGLQTGYVEAIKHLKTELAMCIDSDDMALPDTVKLIEDTWNEYKDDRLAGIYGYDCFASGQLIGEPFDDSVKEIDLVELDTGLMKRKVYDRALVIRSELYKETEPSKKYPGERSLNATVLHLQIAQKYRFKLLQKPLILVEYQNDGMTTGMMQQYFTSANTFLDYRLFLLSLPKGTFSFFFWQGIHFVNSCIITGRVDMLFKCPHRSIVFLAIPMGIALHFYTRLKVKK